MGNKKVYQSQKQVNFAPFHLPFGGGGFYPNLFFFFRHHLKKNFERSFKNIYMYELGVYRMILTY